jgi:hypothetical protein
MDCGKTIDVTLDKKTKSILSGDWYYGTHRKGIGCWGKYTLGTPHLKPDGNLNFVRCISRWKELKYRLIDFKRTLFHQYEDIEFWVCKDCVLSEYGTLVQTSSKNPSKRYEEKVIVIEKRKRKKKKK